MASPEPEGAFAGDETLEMVELAIARTIKPGSDGSPSKNGAGKKRTPWTAELCMAIDEVWTAYRVAILQCMYYLYIFLVLRKHALQRRLEQEQTHRKKLMCNFAGGEDRQEAYMSRRNALQAQWGLGDEEEDAEGNPSELKRSEAHIESLKTTIEDGSMSLNLGIIGCGSLGTCMLRALLGSGSFAPERIYVSTRRPETLLHFRAAGVHVMYDNAEVAAKTDLLLVACLPAQLAAVAKELRGKMRPQSLVISAVFGVSADKVKSMLGVSCVLQPVFDASRLGSYGLSSSSPVLGASANDDSGGAILGTDARKVAVVAAEEMGRDNKIIYTVLLALREWCETIELPALEARSVCVECLVGDPRKQDKTMEPVELFKKKFLRTLDPLLDTLVPPDEKAAAVEAGRGGGPR